MKKIILLTLIICAMFSFISCSDDTKDNSQKESVVSPEQDITEIAVTDVVNFVSSDMIVTSVKGESDKIISDEVFITNSSDSTLKTNIEFEDNSSFTSKFDDDSDKQTTSSENKITIADSKIEEMTTTSTTTSTQNNIDVVSISTDEAIELPFIPIE